MKLNRKELRKIQYDFNSLSNRLLQTDYQDYEDVLKKFIKFFEDTPIIIEYVQGCGECEWNVESMVKEVQASHGRKFFPTGNTAEEEVCNVFATLQYIADNNINVSYGVAFGYSTSNKFQDKIKGFNDRFVMVLIRHIESYLTKVGIDMGIDEKIVYNVTVQNGQAIIACDNASVTATTNIGANVEELKNLIELVRVNIDELSQEDKEVVIGSLDIIEEETMAAEPRIGVIKTAIAALSGVKGITEFSAAVVELIQYVNTLI